MVVFTNIWAWLLIGLKNEKSYFYQFMINYLEDILVEAPACFDSKNVTPAISDLFQVMNVSNKYLDEDMADYFHRSVVRFLYAAKRLRLYIQVAVAFLCKRVKEPTTEDWKKLSRLIWYPPSSNAFTTSTWIVWIWKYDLEYQYCICGTHGHEEPYGVLLNSWWRAPISGSAKQENTARSSTELELCGVDKAISFVEWSGLFFVC